MNAFFTALFASKLFQNPKFWLAFIGVLQSILLHYFTSVPESIWLSIDALIGVVIASLTATDLVVAIRMLNKRMEEVQMQLRLIK